MMAQICTLFYDSVAVVNLDFQEEWHKRESERGAPLVKVKGYKVIMTCLKIYTYIYMFSTLDKSSSELLSPTKIVKQRYPAIYWI